MVLMKSVIKLTLISYLCWSISNQRCKLKVAQWWMNPENHTICGEYRLCSYGRETSCASCNESWDYLEDSEVLTKEFFV